jgi:RHS repeat-associated protein
MMTNSAAQTVAWQAKYDPFGNAVTISTAITNNQRLPGQWFQIEDGLAYNWHRNYDPTLGRYSQADPLGFVDGPSLQSYAKQSPLMKVYADGRTVIGPMSKPPKPKPPKPLMCKWDDKRKECHENCRSAVGYPDAFSKYWKCVNECMAME